MPKRIIENLVRSKEELNTSNWPTVFIDNLDENDQLTFKIRKNAVDLYMEGKLKVKDVSEISGINETDIRRLVYRCLEYGEDGRVLGYRALIPRKRIKTYSSKKNDFKNNPGNFSGAFKNLLDKHPEIDETIKKYYFGTVRNEITEHIISVKNLHKKFIKVCKAVGLDPTKNDYPFNTKDMGRRSLYRYVKELENNNLKLAAKRKGDETLRHVTSTGQGTKNTIIERPYQRVEFDGHKIDSIFVLKFSTPEGDEIVDILHRIWILTIMDSATRTILGYHLSLNREYSSEDVLKCIRNAVVPWKPKEFCIPNLKYTEGSGFPSGLIPETSWALWDEFAYDNALANIANIVTDRLKKVVGSSINAGPVAHPERRGMVEKFFDVLEENGFHRLINTTGSGKNDPRRKNAEKNAIKYEMTVDELDEIVEVLVANRNITPQEGTNYLTPLEVMKQRINRGTIPRVLPEEKRNETIFLTQHFTRQVRGNRDKGRRPYINYEGVEYRSDVLSNNFKLVGTTLTILSNIDDLRVLHAFLPDGSELGILKAKGKWGIRKHSLRERKAINKLRNNKEIYISNNVDPIDVYYTHLNEKSKNSKDHRTKLANLEKKIKEDFSLESNDLSNQIDTNDSIKELISNNNINEKIVSLNIKKNNEEVFYNEFIPNKRVTFND